MKEVFKILEKNKFNFFQKIIDTGNINYPKGEWGILQLVDDIAQDMLGKVERAMPLHFKIKINTVDFEFLNKVTQGDRILIKSQVYPLGKSEAKLKVFIHDMDKRGRALKLAQASYNISLLRKTNLKVA